MSEVNIGNCKCKNDTFGVFSYLTGSNAPGMKKHILLLAIAAACIMAAVVPATAQVWVYDYPDTIVYTAVNGRNFRSVKYDVRVIQNDAVYPSYVLADYNTFPDGSRDKMTEWNHSTTFSFQGPVQVEVMKKDSSGIGTCNVYPLTLEIPWTIENGNKLVITLDEPRKMYVEMQGMGEHPLFIFADPPEEEVPDPQGADVELITTGMTALEVKTAINGTTKEVIYFEKGVHFYGEETNNTYPGYQLPVRSEKTYYIPGGAFVVGSLRGSGVNNTTIRGRGIISACGKERLAQSESIPFNLIYLDNGGENQVVEGLTFTNPAHFVVLSRGQMAATNLKMFGWWHQTDGFGGEHGSSLHDAFIKVNDDFVKVYRDNQRFSNLVIYKQINGAAFQLGWNTYGSASGCKVSDIYIVKDDDKVPGSTSNTAVISLVNNGGSTISNNTFERIYIENDVQRTIGIKVQGGSVQNLWVSELYHSGKDKAGNYLIAEDGGLIKDVYLNLNYYGEKCMRSKEDYNMRFEGAVEGVYFIGCPQDPTGITAPDPVDGPARVTCMDEPGTGGTLYVSGEEKKLKGNYTLYSLGGQTVQSGLLAGPVNRIRVEDPGLFILKLDLADGNVISGKYLIH